MITAQGDAYIALLGRSTWALVNAYHAVLREKGLRPKQVSIVTEEPYASKTSTVAEAIRIISEGYGFTPVIRVEVLPEADFVQAGRTIDITSGRKVIVAGALIAVSLAGLDLRHIYYLAMKTTDNVAKPYMMIPHQIQKIRDIMEDAGVRP
jgi:hypothetical protein